MKLTGSCYCRCLQYELNLESVDDARTSLCHCYNCKACHLIISNPSFNSTFSDWGMNRKHSARIMASQPKFPKIRFATLKGNQKNMLQTMVLAQCYIGSSVTLAEASSWNTVSVFLISWPKPHFHL